jgi:hypothetical protein
MPKPGKVCPDLVQMLHDEDEVNGADAQLDQHEGEGDSVAAHMPHRDGSLTMDEGELLPAGIALRRFFPLLTKSL